MSDKWIPALIAVVVLALFAPLILREVGDGERQGVVVYTRKSSFPTKHTLVWMRFYYTDGIMNENSFVRAYYGWHDFELGKLYKINYHKEWNWLYKAITNVEIVELD